MSSNERLFSDAELEKFFGSRDLFQQMSPDQQEMLFSFVAYYFEVDRKALEAAIYTTHGGVRAIKLDDYGVYMAMRGVPHKEDRLLSKEEAQTLGRLQALKVYQIYTAYLKQNRQLAPWEPTESILDINLFATGAKQETYLKTLKMKKVYRENGQFDFCWGADKDGVYTYDIAASDCQWVIEDLKLFSKKAFDIVICNQTFQNVSEEDTWPLLDQIARTCRKYFIIRDEEFSGDQQKINSWVIKKELHSGVLWPSVIPEQALERGYSYPVPLCRCDTKFGIQKLVDYLVKSGEFSVVYEVKQKVTASSQKTFILKKTGFTHQTQKVQPEALVYRRKDASHR